VFSAIFQLNQRASAYSAAVPLLLPLLHRYHTINSSRYAIQ
jgi:hypothetical protein